MEKPTSSLPVLHAGRGEKFVRFTYKFNGTVQDASNQPVTVSTPVVEVPLNEMK